MQQSTNYNMNKPELTDQYDLQHWNDNTDIIDTELKKRENDDTALKNPAYTVPASDANLVSGEGFQTAFGKIAKAISSFITHKGETTSVHGSTSAKTASKIIERDANARAKVADGVDIDDIATLEQIQNSALNKKFIGVKTVATSNITLYGEQVIDSLSCVVGDIILVSNQTTATENGIYIVQTGAWTRHSDYDSADEINNTLICIYNGTNKGKVYKATTSTFVDGTTTLTFSSANYLIADGAKRFWRDKINACEERRPPIGIPTIWFGPKPDWALDFGNGSSIQYLWANYPELKDDDQFKTILKQFSDRGWMTAYDTSGFYVPDLRGIVPIGYGLNAIRTSETTNGGDSPGWYLSSTNKEHTHTPYALTFSGQYAQAYSTKTDGTPWANGSVNNVNSHGSATMVTTYSSTNTFLQTGSSSASRIMSLGFGTTPQGTVSLTLNNQGTTSKPPTVGCMYIVRFE